MNIKTSIIIVVILAIVALLLYRGAKPQTESVDIRGGWGSGMEGPIMAPEGPANFRIEGTIVYEQYDESHISPPLFRYADPEGNVGTSTLLILAESMCGDEIHMTPCMALSVAMPFANQRAIVVGTQREDQIFVQSITRVE